jgi:surfeit locus 1 family protein
MVLLAMLVMIRLGIWQLDRLAERRAANAELVAALAADPLTLTGDPLPGDVADLQDRWATVSGEYDVAAQQIIRLQDWQGILGVNLVTPLRIEGSDTAVLVNRGWVPQTVYEAGELAQFDPTGPQTIRGQIALSQPFYRYGDRSTEQNGLPNERYRIDIAEIQANLPYPVLPVYLLLAAPEDSPALPDALPYLVESDIDLSEGPHLSYALQWFLFTITLAVIYLVLVVKKMDGKEPE